MKKLINLFRAWNLQRKLRRMNKLAGWKYFKRECRHANHMAKYNNKRYRVYLFDKYRALSRDDVQRMKNYGQLSKKDSTGILSKNAFYDTQTGANTHPDFCNRKI
jgi:hypothetical protein